MTDLHTTQFWEAVKDSLKTTIPNKSTYDANILPTRLLSVENGTYIVETTEATREHLKERLYKTLVRAIAAVARQSADTIRVEFVVNGPVLPPVESADLDWTTVSAELLDFNPYGTGGYFAKSNYIQKHWGAYLGAPAMQLIDYIRSFYDEPAFVYDKRAKKNIPNPNWTPWTPPRDFHLSDLVRAIKGTDKQVRGCWRTCHRYNQELVQGIVKDFCFCDLHAGELALGKPFLPDYPDGKPICHFWRAGLLDLLQIEEIITVQPQGDPFKPATVMFRIQVFQPLPLLTPWQVGQLANSIQDEHRKWLSRHGYNLAAWGAIPVERLMPLVKLYPKWLRG